MELRNHPLMSYKGSPNWPPAWVWIGGDEKVKRVSGEIGILLDVVFPRGEPYNRCYLIIQQEHAVYIGTLLFDDVSFCRKIFGILQGCSRRSIQQIGGLDVSNLA